MTEVEAHGGELCYGQNAKIGSRGEDEKGDCTVHVQA